MAMRDQQEQLLRAKMQYVELLGEVDLSSEWAKEFSVWVANLINNDGLVKALRYVKERYSSCLAIYLVTKGVYGYEGGNYWSSVSTDIGLDVLSSSKSLSAVFSRY